MQALIEIDILSLPIIKTELKEKNWLHTQLLTVMLKGIP